MVGEPVCGLGQVDEAVLDRGGLGVQAHDLVAVRFVWRDARKAGVKEILDQLGSRRFVLDQNDRRVEKIILFAYGPLEVGKGELLAQNVEEIEGGSLDAPSGADGVIGKLRRLVRCVPTLDDLIEAFRALVGAIAAEPGLLDDAAAGGRRRLLVLPAKLYSPMADRMRASVSTDSRSA